MKDDMGFSSLLERVQGTADADAAQTSSESDSGSVKDRANGATRSRVDAASQGETFGITCTECGGSLRVHEGERSIRCEYCDSALYVTRPQGVRSFLMQPRITAGKARLAALQHLSKETRGRIKARHASIVDQQLIQVPFWRLHGRLMGWVCGEKSNMEEYEIPAGHSSDGGERTIKSVREVRQPFSKLVFKRVDWSTPACILKKLGLQGISLRTGFLDWDIFDHELKSEQNIALPMRSEKRAYKDAYNYLTKITSPMGSRVKGSRYHMFDSTLSIYYYPVYFLRYRHKELLYTVTVDGGDGHVIRGEVPRQTKTDYRGLFFLPALFAFLAGTWLPLLFIAIGATYAYDMIQASTFVSPFRWVPYRLNSLFERCRL
jgi:DNA-directed RNA polymerase subunit RPC12/RpoP